MTATQPNRSEIETKIVKRCWRNDAFRKQFVSDPAGCLTKYFNVPKARLPKITVHEEQPGSWHIVLPTKPAKADELSDEELEKIAGGTDVAMTYMPDTLVTNVATATPGGDESSPGWQTTGW